MVEELTELEIRRIAVEVPCDVRTVRKYLKTPDDVRLSVRQRIVVVVREMLRRNAAGRESRWGTAAEKPKRKTRSIR